jgi:hypothetical protein
MKRLGSLLGRFGLYAALGLIDLALTCYLLQAAPGQVYEGNPIARWWLLRCGWVGLAGFKVAVVLLVLTAVQGIARSRPRTAARVLTFACGATALVICYSCILLGSACAQGRVFSGDNLARVKAEAARLDTRVRQMQAYYQLRGQLAADLNARRYPLEELVSRLEATPQAREPAWLKALRRAFPGRSDRERMAALILYHARLLNDARATAATAETGADHPQPARRSRGDLAFPYGS